MKVALLALMLIGCTRPPPVTPPGQGAPLCATPPRRIYYGSCAAKLAPGPASCVLCDGARACTAYPGAYCVGAAACDDLACK